MIASTREIFERHGVQAAAKYAGFRLAQRIADIDVTHFMIQDVTELPATKHKRDVECRFLSSDEVRQLAEDPENDLPLEIADRLDLGYDLCFAGLVEGRVACYCWFALHSVEARNNSSTGRPGSGIAISFPEEYAFRYKGFTHPQFRGRRLYSLVACEAAKAMQTRGCQFILSSAEWVNPSALKSSYRSGFRYLGVLSVVKIFGRRYVRHPEMAEQGIYFDGEAEVIDRGLFNMPCEKLSDLPSPNHQATAATR